MERKIFQQLLLEWYQKNNRDLPWRKTTDPYAILVSEFMLQQTQVDRVIPKYNAFLQRFPTMQKLAAASLGDVLSAWSGLGFNRRALHLLNIAKITPLFPTTPEELHKLKGIGEYTSRAVASFAYNYPAAVVDINVKRVYSRIFGSCDIDGIAQEMLPQDSRTWNNAIMDFGAMVCVAENPHCFSCPFSSACKAFSEVKDPLKIIPIAAPPQSKFVGSRRYYRGQLLKLLKEQGETEIKDLQTQWKKKEKWIKELVTIMEKEGLVKMENDTVVFP